MTSTKNSWMFCKHANEVPCEHANEVPIGECPCGPDCICRREGACKPPTPAELNRATAALLKASSKVKPPDHDCQHDVRKSTSSTKTTILEGYFATGDMECFCFDKCPGPHAHNKLLQADPQYHAWHEGEINDFDPDRCRVYPNALLPEDSDHKRGTWNIAITFTPDRKQ